MTSFLQVVSFDPLVIESGAGVAGPAGPAGPAGNDRIGLARIPESLISGSVTRDANGAILSAAVTWPDGTAGTFTADVVSTTFPGAIDAWHITYAGSPAATFTQPQLTRDTNGAVTILPAIVVS